MSQNVLYSGFTVLKSNDMINYKINLVLDLDETLIHTIFISDEETIKKFEKKDCYLVKFQHANGWYLVYHRPRLFEFLVKMADNFSLILYTMASTTYASYVVNEINRRIGYMFMRIISREDFMTLPYKSLSHMLINEKNSIIIDDRVDVWPNNLNNLLSIKPFLGPRDEEDRCYLLDNELNHWGETALYIKSIFQNEVCIDSNFCFSDAINKWRVDLICS